jgi:hypothetical protein
MYTRKKRLPGFIITMLSLAGVCGGVLASEAIAADTADRTMTIVRLYTGSDNQSHFEDVRIPLKSTGKIGFISELMKATGIVFRETGGDYNYDFHTAPRRQYVVNLEGEVEIEVGDGSKRILRSGDVLLAEDTTGQGHISRAVAGKPRKSLFITLD